MTSDGTGVEHWILAFAEMRKISTWFKIKTGKGVSTLSRPFQVAIKA
jgi:hypothetical protein